MKNRLLFFIILIIFGCTKKQEQAPTTLTGDQRVFRGKSIYLSNCIACHNVNPSIDGSVGPAVSGSSLELLEARILRAQYPEAHKPKRESQQMPAFPQLKSEIPAIHAYLNSAEVPKTN